MKRRHLRAVSFVIGSSVCFSGCPAVEDPRPPESSQIELGPRSPQPTSENQNPALGIPERITVVPAVALIKAPEDSAQILLKLPLGTVVTWLDPPEITAATSDNKAGAGAPTPAATYAKVKTLDRVEGWVRLDQTESFSSENMIERYLKVMTTTLERADLKGSDVIETIQMAERVRSVPSTEKGIAQLEVLHLEAMGRLAPLMTSPPPQELADNEWVKANLEQFRCDEQGKECAVNAELWWRLQERFAANPMGDEIAWIAAQKPLAPPCAPGDLCEASASLRQEGRYLQRYPKGQRVEDALGMLKARVDRLSESFARDPSLVAKSVGNGTFVMGLRSLQVAVMSTVHPKKEEVNESIQRVLQALTVGATTAQ